MKYERIAESKREARAMGKQTIGSIAKYFGELLDPRTGNAKAHIFLEILIIATLAMICEKAGSMSNAYKSVGTTTISSWFSKAEI